MITLCNFNNIPLYFPRSTDFENVFDFKGSPEKNFKRKKLKIARQAYQMRCFRTTLKF